MGLLNTIGRGIRQKHQINGRRTLYIVPVFLVFGIMGLSSYLLYTMYALTQEYQNKVYPNIQIDGHDVSGKTVQEIIASHGKKQSDFSNITISIVYNDQKVATFSAEQISLRSNIDDIANHAFLVGRSPHTPTKLRELAEVTLGLTRRNFKTSLAYDTRPFDEFINQAADTYNYPPENALFTFKENRVELFRADKKGLKIDEEQLRKDLDAALGKLYAKPESKTITLRTRTIEPEITLAEANDLGIEELIAEGKSDYSGSSADRIYNLKLAASKFHGILIPPGETFSFNKTIGDISSSTGYRPSYIIKNGKTVLGDGGGVCQVSTTAFRAALNAGLPIVERHAHAYRVSYYENDSKPGFDATIYTPSVDLRFTNDTPKHILIQTHVDEENRLLFFRLYGKKDNRMVEISDATVWDEAAPPEPRYEDDPNLPEGEQRQIEYAAYGAKSRFTYKVTKNGKVAFEKEFFSSYRPWGAVFLVGKRPE